MLLMTSTTTTPQRGVLASFAFLLVSMLSAQAFAFDVGGLRYTVTSGTTVSVVWILLRGNPDKDLVIPATASDGTTTYSVTAIGGYGFYVKALTSVTIPDSVTTIGESAFYGNALTSAAFEGDFGNFDLTMFLYNSALATITYCDGTTGWPQGFNNNSTIVVTTPIVCLPPGC